MLSLNRQLIFLCLFAAFFLPTKGYSQGLPMTTSNSLRLWLKADTGVIADVNGKISQWNDQSTNLNHAVQGIPTNQPTLWISPTLKAPAVRFDTKGYLSTLPIKTTGSDFSVIAVFKKEGVPIGDHEIAVRSSTFTGLTNYFQIYSTNGTSPLVLNLSGSNADCSSVTKINTNGFWIVSVTRQDKVVGGSKIAIDGNPDASSSLTFSSTNSMGSTYPIYLGGWSTKRANISLAEILYYDRVLSQTERESVEDYLGVKYGLPDEDGNGLNDDWERQYFGAIGQDPNADPDGDGLKNIDEFKYGTNPLKADTDNDQVNDKTEILQGRNPLKGSISDNGTYVNLNVFTPLE